MNSIYSLRVGYWHQPNPSCGTLPPPFDAMSGLTHAMLHTVSWTHSSPLPLGGPVPLSVSPSPPLSLNQGFLFICRTHSWIEGAPFLRSTGSTHHQRRPRVQEEAIRQRAQRSTGQRTSAHTSVLVAAPAWSSWKVTPPFPTHTHAHTHTKGIWCQMQPK